MVSPELCVPGIAIRNCGAPELGLSPELGPRLLVGSRQETSLSVSLSRTTRVRG